MKRGVETIYGVHAVKALLLRRPERIVRLQLLTGRDDARMLEVMDLARRHSCRVDRAIDQGRFPRSQGIGESLREPLRIESVVTDAAKSFDQLFVTRLLHQDGRSGVGATTAVNVVATVNSTVVEDDSDDG